MKNKFIASLFKTAGRFALIGMMHSAALATNAAPLPSYQVDLSQTSVSGLSSGAFMAAQFHVAFSSALDRASLTAGGPFYCACLTPILSAHLANATTICINSHSAIASDASALLPVSRLLA